MDDESIAKRPNESLKEEIFSKFKLKMLTSGFLINAALGNSFAATFAAAFQKLPLPFWKGLPGQSLITPIVCLSRMHL